MLILMFSCLLVVCFCFSLCSCVFKLPVMGVVGLAGWEGWRGEIAGLAAGWVVGCFLALC